MIQLFYFVTSAAMMVSIGIAWLSSVWYLRTANTLYRDLMRMFLIIMLRLIIQNTVYIYYNMGNAHFLSILYSNMGLDVLLVALLIYYYLKMFLRLIHLDTGKVFRIIPKAYAVIVFLGTAVNRMLYFLGQTSSTTLLETSRWYALQFAVFLAVCVILLLGNLRFRKEGDIIRRTVWSGFLLMSVFLVPAYLADHFIHTSYWIETSRAVYNGGFFSSITLIVTMLPIFFLMMSIITRFRSALTFIDVDRAVEAIRSSVELTDTQEEILRYIFSRGWGDSLQFYGYLKVRREMAPLQKKMGISSLFHLVHRVEIEQFPELEQKLN